jgi:hypothetical protein
MAHYRLYFLGRDGRFATVVDLDCEDDGAAIEAAEGEAPPLGFELWSGSRLVLSRRTDVKE